VWVGLLDSIFVRVWWIMVGVFGVVVVSAGRYHVAVFIDGEGRTLEVITIDRGHGPRPVVRATWHGYLLGVGYYPRIEDALALVDVESLVEVVTLPTAETSL
jgi:hypothetical protein